MAWGGEGEGFGWVGLVVWGGGGLADFELFAGGGGVEFGEVAGGVDGGAVRVGHFGGVVDETAWDTGCGTADCFGESWAGESKRAVHVCQCIGSDSDSIVLRGLYTLP